MVTVISAYYKRGYSSQDHLINDGPLANMVGRSYKDAGAAKRAANVISQRWGSPQRYLPISLTLCVEGHEIEVEA